MVNLKEWVSWMKVSLLQTLSIPRSMEVLGFWTIHLLFQLPWSLKEWSRMDWKCCWMLELIPFWSWTSKWYTPSLSFFRLVSVLIFLSLFFRSLWQLWDSWDWCLDWLHEENDEMEFRKFSRRSEYHSHSLPLFRSGIWFVITLSPISVSVLRRFKSESSQWTIYRG